MLAGGPDAKAVFIVMEADGAVVRSFGVTKEATGIAAQSAEGPLLLSVGSERDGNSVGALEEWSLYGKKQRVAPLPAEALAVTRVVDGVAFALLGSSSVARAAIPVDVHALRVGPPIPLPARTASLEQCRSDERTLLLFADEHGSLTLRDLTSGNETHRSLAAHSAACHAGGGGLAYVVEGGIFSRSLSVLSVPDLHEISSVSASRDAIAVVETDDHQLIALNSTDRIGTIETFKEESSAERTAYADIVAPDSR